MNGMPRLDWILKQIRSSVVTGYKEPSVNFVVFEDLAFAAHDRNHERAGLATLVRHMLWEEGIPYVLVAPTTLKKFVTGSGKADKSQMMLAVYKHWAITPANDNEADAIGLLQIGLALASPDSPSIPKYQQECLAVIRKNNPHI
jgi:Holliday junction resolvasome RuvABC endonuclease subunit